MQQAKSTKSKFLKMTTQTTDFGALNLLKNISRSIKTFILPLYQTH